MMRFNVRCPKCRGSMSPEPVPDFDDRIRFVCDRNSQHKNRIKLLRTKLKKKWITYEKYMKRASELNEVFFNVLECYLETYGDEEKLVEECLAHCPKMQKKMCQDISALHCLYCEPQKG